MDLDIARIGSLSRQEINTAVSRLVAQPGPNTLARELLEESEIFTELVEHIAAVQSGSTWISHFAHAADAESLVLSLGEDPFFLSQLTSWMPQPNQPRPSYVVASNDDEGLTQLVRAVATSPVAAHLTTVLVDKRLLTREMSHGLTSVWRNGYGNPFDSVAVATLAAMPTNAAIAVLTSLAHDPSPIPLARSEKALNRQPNLLIGRAVMNFAFDLGSDELFEVILELGLHHDTMCLVGEFLRDPVAADALLTEVASERTTVLFQKLAQTHTESLATLGIDAIVDAKHRLPSPMADSYLIQHTLGNDAWRAFQREYLEMRPRDQDRAESMLKEQLDRTGIDIGHLVVVAGVLAAAKTVIGVVGSMAQPLVFAGAVVAVAEAIRVDDNVRDNDKIQLIEVESDAIVVNRALRDRAFMPYYDLFEYDGPRDWLHACLPRFDESFATIIYEDLVPWVSSWPAEELRQLRHCLEYELVHDHKTWPQELENWYLDFGYEPIDEAMRPLWDGVFGGEPNARPISEYRVLGVEQGNQAIKDFDPGQPDWPWMETIDRFEDELKLARLIYISVSDEMYGQATAADEPPIQHQGLVGLDHAKQWHDQAMQGAWLPPTDGQPIEIHSSEQLRNAERKAACVMPVGTYSSDAKASDVDPKYREQWWHSFDDLRLGLVAASAGLGMHCGVDLERGIEEARELEASNTTPYRCWEAWAVIAASLLKAERTDRYLKWSFGPFVTAEQQQAFRQRVITS